LGELLSSTTGSHTERPDSDKRVKIFEAEIKENKLKIDKLMVQDGKLMDWQGFVNGYLNN
jgi:hypothetical protein